MTNLILEHLLKGWGKGMLDLWTEGIIWSSLYLPQFFICKMKLIAHFQETLLKLH